MIFFKKNNHVVYKSLLFFAVLTVSISTFLSAPSIAEQWGKRWDNPDSWKKGGRHKEAAKNKIVEKKTDESQQKRKERYCSSSQQPELLDLLQELKDKKYSRKHMMGGASEVQAKNRIARKLRRFDDCRAEDALQELINEDACEDRGEGEVLCVKWVAKSSLQQIKATADLNKLKPETPLEEQKKIIKKYTKRPYTNNYAVQHIKKFVDAQAPTNPKFYIPLMVDCFPMEEKTQHLLKQNPQLVKNCLNECFNQTDATKVWWGIKIAKFLERSDFLNRVHEVAFLQKGNLDYTQKQDLESVRLMALSFYRNFESQSVSYLRDVLYSDFPKSREYAISGIKDMRNPELLAILKEYANSITGNSRKDEPLLHNMLQKKITMMEDAQK